jgi:hypothetical protein
MSNRYRALSPVKSAPVDTGAWPRQGRDLGLPTRGPVTAADPPEPPGRPAPPNPAPERPPSPPPELPTTGQPPVRPPIGPKPEPTTGRPES